MPLDACKAMISVVAGIIPDEPIAEYTKRWNYSNVDYELDKKVPDDQPTTFSKMLDEAHEHAKGLSNPHYVNWVRVDWIWV